MQYLQPCDDMPNSVKGLYNEASLIYNKSPRAACALLRFAVERLCNELGETGKIDTMIGNLVKKDYQLRLSLIHISEPTRPST